MSTVTDNDLQQLKNLINQKFEETNQNVNKKFEEVNNNIVELKLEQRELKTRLDSFTPSINKISDLSEKVGELKNWRQIALIIITGVLTTFFWLLRDSRI
jgi:uncharacterized coiled-coil DUF342 family protein